jgi:hypothetical protein
MADARCVRRRVPVVVLARIERMEDVGIVVDDLAAGERILLLVADRDVRVVNENGEPIRQLTIDPSRDDQGRGPG